MAKYRLTLTNEDSIVQAQWDLDSHSDYRAEDGSDGDLPSLKQAVEVAVMRWDVSDLDVV